MRVGDFLIVEWVSVLVIGHEGKLLFSDALEGNGELVLAGFEKFFVF